MVADYSHHVGTRHVYGVRSVTVRMELLRNLGIRNGAWNTASNLCDSVFYTRSLAYFSGGDRWRRFAQLSRSRATRGSVGL
jgi:hypothetical protein